MQKKIKDDMISRQVAIDALTENKEMINAVLDSLTLDYNTRRNQEQRRGQINEDIETIKALPSAQPKNMSVTFDVQKITKHKSDFSDLPSAQPERKIGEWLELTNTNHTYVCSVCGRMLVNITDGKNTVTKNYPFCHCGADMRGEQDE